MFEFFGCCKAPHTDRKPSPLEPGASPLVAALVGLPWHRVCSFADPGQGVCLLGRGLACPLGSLCPSTGVACGPRRTSDQLSPPVGGGGSPACLVTALWRRGWGAVAWGCVLANRHETPGPPSPGPLLERSWHHLGLPPKTPGRCCGRFPPGLRAWLVHGTPTGCCFGRSGLARRQRSGRGNRRCRPSRLS